MKSARAFRYIAFGNIVCGASLGIWTVIGVSRTTFIGGSWLMPALFVVQVVIASSLVYSAWRHLRAPSRRRALALASNSSVIIWILGMMLLRPIGSSGVSAQVYALAALLVAFLIYRFFLRPTAMRTFPEYAERA